MTTAIPEPSGPPAVETGRPEETRVYAVGVLKGGTGKTRLAMLIALFLAIVLGRKVVLFDADSASMSSMKWMEKAKRRGYTWPIEVIRHPFENLDEIIDQVKARGDVDDIVVDVGGGNVGCFLAAMRRTNMVLVPLCPDEGDVEQAQQTREAVFMGASRNTTGKDVDMWYLLNRCENSNDRVDAREVLLYEDQQDGPFPLLDIELPSLVAYKRTFGRIPGPKRADELPDDELRPRWKDLVNFVPFLIETGIITSQQALDTKVITRRELEKVSI